MSILVDKNTRLLVQGITGREGEFQISKKLPEAKPGTFTLHATGMNANGKVYILDRVYSLIP